MGFTCVKSESGHSRRLFSIAGLLLSILLLSTRAYGGWTDPSSWNQLKKNLTSDEVTKLIGTPKDKEATSLREVWYYQQTPVRQDGKVVSRPKQGFVNFSKLSTNPVTRQRLSESELFVSTWAVPDWTAITEEEKNADLPEVNTTLPEMPSEMDEEIRKMQEEASRRIEEDRKQAAAEFERRQQEAMERMQKRQQEMRQRVQDVNVPAMRTPRPNFPSQPYAAPSQSSPMQPPSQENVSTATKIGAVVGFVIGIVLVVGIPIGILIIIILIIKKLLSK